MLAPSPYKAYLNIQLLKQSGITIQVLRTSSGADAKCIQVFGSMKDLDPQRQVQSILECCQRFVHPIPISGQFVTEQAFS